MKHVIFDIETGPLPRADIERIAPAFNESNVKAGNLGIEKTIEKITTLKARHLDKIIDEAALEAEYGETLAIGILAENVTEVLLGDEATIIADFWKRAYDDFRAGGIVWVGHHSNIFDLPFLLRRSLIKGVKIPPGITPHYRYWPDFWVDLEDVWRAGNFRAHISLDRFCKACGLEGKNGSGKFFSQLFKEDRDAALEYLENDLAITAKLAERVLSCATRGMPR
jgi:hypothetical protein